MRIPCVVDYEKALELSAGMANRPAYRSLEMDERFELCEWVLEWFGIDDGFFGVEYSANDGDDRSRGGCWYLNSGDTYNGTICYPDDGCDFDDGGDFIVSSWGDVYEDFERRMYDDENLVRCGNCSAFTECGDEWRETRCESCGCNVSTGEVMPEPAADGGEGDENE